MARVKGAMMTRKRRNKILKLAKGYWGAKSKHFKMANEQVMKSLQYAYTGRRLKKRDFRQLWIARINAACKTNGMNYSTFMHGLKLAGVEINRKMLSELAVNDKAAFTQLTELAKSKLAELSLKTPDSPGIGRLWSLERGPRSGKASTGLCPHFPPNPAFFFTESPRSDILGTPLGGETMSANRLIQILSLLLEHDRITAPQLAQMLQVSVSTIYREIDALSAAGVPVCTAPGKNGGVTLMAGCAPDPNLFTPGEQQQLLAALDDDQDAQREATLAKLSALFRRPEEDWLQVYLTHWGASAGDTEDFKLLREAILQRRAVQFTYASSQGEQMPYLVQPVRLVFQGNGWYLQAYCPFQECYRTFRLTRMLDLTITDQPFHRLMNPPAPELSGEIPPLFRVEAELRFAPSLAHRVYDEFDRRCVTPQPDGSLLVSTVFPDGGWLASYLLSFGGGVEVLSPASLQRQLAQASELLRQAYAQ